MTPGVDSAGSPSIQQSRRDRPTHAAFTLANPFVKRRYFFAQPPIGFDQTLDFDLGVLLLLIQQRHGLHQSFDLVRLAQRPIVQAPPQRANRQQHHHGDGDPGNDRNERKSRKPLHDRRNPYSY